MYKDPTGHDGEVILGIALMDGPQPGPADAVAIISYAGYNISIYGPQAVDFASKFGPIVFEKAKEVGGYIVDKGKEGVNWIKSKVLTDPLILEYGQDEVAQDIIAKDKKGLIWGEFPKEYADKTLGEIEKDAKAGNKTAQKAKKLLKDKCFDKKDNRK